MRPPDHCASYVIAIDRVVVVRSSAALRDLLDALTALAVCCGFDLWHKYILYLYLYLYWLRCITIN